MKIAIIGAGAWGTALAISAATVKDNLVGLNILDSLSAKARLRGVKAHLLTVAVDQENRVLNRQACRYWIRKPTG